jgi:asparagine synthase (glutamine-hydrolysing)
MDLFECVSKIPTEFKISQKGETKWILKEIMKKNLPKKIIERKKMGFTVPIDKILEQFKLRVLETIENTAQSELSSVIKVNKIKNLADRYYQGDKTVSGLEVWTLFVLCFWFVNIYPRFQDINGFGKGLIPKRRE